MWLAVKMFGVKSRKMFAAMKRPAVWRKDITHNITVAIWRKDITHNITVAIWRKDITHNLATLFGGKILRTR